MRLWEMHLEPGCVKIHWWQQVATIVAKHHLVCHLVAMLGVSATAHGSTPRSLFSMRTDLMHTTNTDLRFVHFKIPVRVMWRCGIVPSTQVRYVVFSARRGQILWALTR